MDDPTLFDAPVQSLMKPTFPSVNIDETINDAIALLSKKHPAVLIEEKGSVVGIVTR